MDDTAPGPGVASCPRCGTSAPLPIYYGYPEPHHIRAALRGEIALGGVVHQPDPPAFECRDDDCGYTFTP
jgi:hypothetical protein